MEQKPRIAIFKNDKVGQPIKRKDGSDVEYKGEPMLHCDLNGKITLPEGLAAGEYDVSIYKRQSKAGLTFYAGTIKAAFKSAKKGDDSWRSKVGLEPKPKEDSFNPDLDDSVPF